MCIYNKQNQQIRKQMFTLKAQCANLEILNNFSSDIN